MRTKKTKILLLVIAFLTGNAMISFSQKIQVFSAEDNTPIPSAHITCKTENNNTEKIFVTDTNGFVDISTFEKSSPEINITVSFLGFKKRKEKINRTGTKNIYLEVEKTALNEVVVTAQYAPNSPEKAVHKIKIIDSKKIQTMGAQNLKDVLSNELNIRLSQDNILGSGMSLQGVSGQNIKILIDGVPLNGRLNGNIDLSQINMNNVERIEIVEGPLSVNYGTDALGGTINIITKKTQKHTITISSNNYYESNGQYNFTGKIGFHKKNNLISLSGGRNYFDGWRSTDKPFLLEKERVADSLRYHSWKPKEQYFATLFFNHYFNKLKLNYTGDYFYEEIINKGLPRAPYSETAFDDYYTTNRITNSLNTSGNINKKLFVNILAAHSYFNRIKNTYFKDLTNLTEILTENANDQDTSSFKNIMSRGSISTTIDSSKINAELGYDINHETANGFRIKNHKQQIGDYALYASAEYKPISSIIIRPGVRVIYNTSYKAPIVPSLNIKFSPENKELKNESHTIRFSYARGFRAPSLKELYFYFVDINHNITGNNNLKAEQSHNFNLSYTFNKSKQNVSWKSEAILFYNYIENMISLAQISGTQYSYFNIDQFQTNGIQFQNEISIHHLKITIGGGYIGRYNQFQNTVAPDKFSYSPEAKFNTFYELHKYKTTFAIYYKYTGKTPGFALQENNEIVKTSIDDYHTADMTLSKYFFKQRVNITAGIKNIFDVKNINGNIAGDAHSSSGNSITIGMGRTYFFKIDININSKK